MLNKIITITDAHEVDKIKKVLLLRNEQKRKSELDKLKNKSLSERYGEGDQSVAPAILDILKNGDAEAKNKMYEDLSASFVSKAENRNNEKELIEIILRDINDPMYEYYAVLLADILKPPGYVEVLESRLLSGESTDSSSIISVLSYEGKSTRTLKYISDLIDKDAIPIDQKDGILWSLYNFGENGNDDIKKYVGEIAFKAYQKKWSYEKERNYDTEEQEEHSTVEEDPLLLCLFHFGKNEIIPIAQDYINSGIEDIEVLKALVRLEGAKHKKLVHDYLKDGDNFINALELGLDLYKLTKDETIIKQIFMKFKRNEDFEIRTIRQMISALIQVQAIHYFDKLSEIIQDKELITVITQSYNAQKHSIEEVANDLYEMEIVDEPIDKNIIQKIKDTSRNGDAISYIYNLLSTLKKTLAFEADKVSAIQNYEELIQKFATCSNGKFKNILVQMKTGKQSKGRMEYKITLLYDNRAYMVESEKEREDWYKDLKLIVSLINTALADSGIEQRFIPWDISFYNAQFLFGKEVKAKQFIEKYNLNR